MERLQSLGLPAETPKFVNTLMPFGIIALVAMLVLPLPVALLDTFFVVNITLSLLILMVALAYAATTRFFFFSKPFAYRHSTSSWIERCIYSDCSERGAYRP